MCVKGVELRSRLRLTMVLVFVWVFWVPFLARPLLRNESISLTKIKGNVGEE